MSEGNKTYRIRTNVGSDSYVNVMLDQDYENFEILSLNIDRENAYKMHTSNYGCIAGRVLANGAYGIPNAKISVFVPTKESEEIDPVLAALYPYESTLDKNNDHIRYNTLPDEKTGICHQAVGTFPNKRLVLDDNNVLEIYDKYYKYSAVSNESGDYMIFGVPTGEHIVHVDLDLSDIGDLSQTPRDMIFKGYNVNQFESPSMFKKDTELDTLTQIISQDSSVFVNPFWGDNSSSNISITRNDIDIKYKFEPTCVFIGSLVTDGDNNGISQNCIPSKGMGSMDQLKGAPGTIEMIRKTPEDTVESFVIQGTKLIDGNGTWCYQIPMNLDYMGTDEYGNTVATNDPNKGVPTRTRVRFRLSLTDSSSEYVNNHLAKVLIPNNPSSSGDVDYAFGTYSKDDDEGTKSFRDLFTNNVYTVKSYIPRIQKSKAQRNEHFSGIKNVNVTNGNNPIPYNNMRVNMSFMFILQCAILKIMIRVVRIVNKWRSTFSSKTCIVMGDGVCPDLEGWYFAPGCKDKNLAKTLNNLDGDEEEGKSAKNEVEDTKSIDSENADNNSKCITRNIDYLMQCVEINLAMEYNVIKFDFYNDWINGMIYMPHWYGNIRRKRTYLFGLIKIPERVQACMEDTYTRSRKFIQQCSLTYEKDDETNMYTKVATKLGCKNDTKQKCHTGYGRNYRTIMGPKTGGLVHNELTLKQEHVYYFRPCEWLDTDKKYPTKCNLFATDIVMLGSLDLYNKDGIPTAFNDLSGSSFKLPGNLVSTNLETDGPFYTMSDGSICNTSQPTLENGVQPGTDYQKYAQSTGDYEILEPDEKSEYKISEMSGIDWGFVGPGQGENKLNDLYFPGGHFLGISCFNSETNIKSCINLSRACEVGTKLSQYQEVVSSVTPSTESEYEITYLKKLPNGFISKDEISDSNFRNIFATLNFNGLRTKRNSETNYRQYDLVSNMSFNFDGALTDIINNNNGSYSTPSEIEKFDSNSHDRETVYRYAIEESSRDYYCFRLGLMDTNDDALIRSKYLNNEGIQISMPMYNNSLYFYFGIREGQTAYDRFLDEFYAVCPDETLTEPSITITEVNATEECTSRNGSASFEIDGLGSAYEIKLYKYSGETLGEPLTIKYGEPENNTVYIVESSVGKTSLFSQYRRFTVGKQNGKNGLKSGKYRLSIIALSDSSEYYVEFEIGTNTPEELVPVIDSVYTYDFKAEWDGGSRGPGNVWYRGYIELTKPADISTIKKIEVKDVNGDTISGYDLANDTPIQGYVVKSTERNTLSFYVTEGNTSYSIKYFVVCSDEDIPDYDNGERYYVSMPASFDYYFGGPEATGKKIKRILGKSDNEPLDDNWYKDARLNPGLDGLNGYELWLLEKSLIYDSSMFTSENSEHSIPLTLYGGRLPYTETISGHGEKINPSNNKYLLKRYIDVDTEDTLGYSVDYRSFVFPTYIDESDGESANFGKHIEKLKKLSIVDNTVGYSDLFDYNLDLKDSSEN